MPTTSTAFDLIPIIVAGASVIVAVGLVITIALVGRHRRHSGLHSLDTPIDGMSPLDGTVLGRSAMSRTKTAERLRELDELQHRHVISPEEYVRAREKVLSGR